MDKSEKTLKENLVYKGKIIDLYSDTVMCPKGNKSIREYVHHPGGVCILAVKDGYIYFEKQFRYPYREEILELPAGKLEKDEDPVDAAKRELKEEIGFLSHSLEYITKFYPSVGYTDEILYLYYSESNDEGDTEWDTDELIDIEKVKIEDAYRMLDNNEILDSKTIILLEKMRSRLLK